jgi:anti-sigma factor RsiW
MRCEDHLRRLDGLFEGLLDEGDARRTRAHLAACPACSAAWEEIEREQELYADYWREAQVEPPRWEAVLSRIEAGRVVREAAPAPGLFARWFALLTPSPLGRALVAAALVVAVAAGLFTVGRFSLRRPSPAPESAARRDVADPGPASGVSHEATPTAPESRDVKAPAAEAGPEPSAPRGAALAARVERRAAPRATSLAATHASAAEAADTTAKVPVSDAVAQGGGVAPGPGAEASFKEAVTFNEMVAAARQPVAAGRSPQSEAEVAQHCERMQMLFLSMKNAAAPGTQASADLAYEKGLARRLLNRNALLRREAESQGNLPLAELLDGVAPMLAEVANLSPQSDVLSINERVRRRGLIALLKAYSAGAGEVASRGAY